MFGSPPYVPLPPVFYWNVYNDFPPSWELLLLKNAGDTYWQGEPEYISFLWFDWNHESERIQKKHPIIVYTFDFLFLFLISFFRKDNSGHYIHVGLLFVVVALRFVCPKTQYFVLNVGWPLPETNGLLERPSEKPAVREKSEDKLG